MSLQKVLTTPSRMAATLDWKALRGSSILSLDIHKDRIGMAVASHPSHGSDACTLDSLPIANQRGEVDQTTLNVLRNIVKDNRVCGVVVSWPVQEDTGKMGAACGRVLHTLEDFLMKQQQQQSDDSSSPAPIITPNLPLCFWNHSHLEEEPADKWGRCSSYASTGECSSEDSVHMASEEQYYQDENVAAAQVWNDFCRVHWPALYEQNKYTADATAAFNERNGPDDAWTEEEDWEDTTSYMNVASL